MKIDTDDKKIDEILTRGVGEVFVFDNLKNKLKSGIQLRIKLGFDPTGSNIHIGRAVVLRKLKAFQDLGHRAVFIVGDFTTQTGDPSDKLEKRPVLTSKKIKQNLKNYKEQVGKIIDISKAEFKFNSKWLKKIRLQEISELAESFSVQQMSNRRNFKERIEKGQDVSLREFMYPLMQGYDSVVVKADVEIGGFDQLFNLKAGRTIQKHFKQKEQDIITVQMLEGTDGRKMSTSYGNVINITDEPNQMFGKIMSLKDELIDKYFTLCTNISVEKIDKIKKDIVNKILNPKDAKMELAYEIVKIYHGEKEAKKAEEHFLKTFSRKEIPEDVQTIYVFREEKLSDILLKNNMVSSVSDFKRLIDSGSITNMSDDKKVNNYNCLVKSTTVFRIGKHRFIKIEFE